MRNYYKMIELCTTLDIIILATNTRALIQETWILQN